MGRLAQVLSYVAGAVNRLRVNLGGGNERQVDAIVPAGFDSKPLKDDRSFVVEGHSTGSYKHVGIQSGVGADSLNAGEARVFSRQSDGSIVASVTAFNDGSILVGNEKGSLWLNSDGSVKANGAVISTSGDVTSALGISLTNHIHTAPSGGGPTTPPTAGA